VGVVVTDDGGDAVEDDDGNEVDAGVVVVATSTSELVQDPSTPTTANKQILGILRIGPSLRS
jgi:hypothetical protein